MPKLKLDYQTITGLKPPEKPEEYYDKLEPGLILRLSKAGTKMFSFRYRFGGKNKRMNIGEFPAMSLAEARKRVKKLKVIVIDGRDPQYEKQERIKQQEIKSLEEITFAELASHFKQIHLPTLRENTSQEYKRIIDVELIPVIGKIQAKDLNKGMIISLLDKKAITEGKKSMANRIRARLHSIYEFGVDKGMIEYNPVTATKPYKDGENERERFYSEEEIRKIWEAIKKVKEPARSYLKIITLTGQRRTETQYMRWDQVQKVNDNEFSGWVWIIPAELSKSERTHEVPLSDFAMEIIKGLHDRAPNNPFVFSSIQSPGNPFAHKTINRAVTDIRNTSGVKDFRLHDMRRTASTYLAKLGTPQEVVSKILNHKTGAGGSLVTRIYNRYEYRRERQTALNRWSLNLQIILEGKRETKIHQLANA